MVCTIFFYSSSLFPCRERGILAPNHLLFSSHVSHMIILAFFFRKKGISISYQSRSVVRPSESMSVTILVNVSSPKPLDLATSNFVPR